MIEITDELIEYGEITLKRTDFDNWKIIDKYNNLADLCRGEMKEVKRIRRGINLLNLLSILVVCFGHYTTVFRIKPLALLILLIVAVVFICSYNKRYIVYTVFSSLLLILHPTFGILLLANIMLVAMLEKQDKPLRKQIGYPKFRKIEILFEEADYDAAEMVQQEDVDEKEKSFDEIFNEIWDLK